MTPSCSRGSPSGTAPQLDENPAVDTLRRYLAEHAKVTLLYGAKDAEHNQAVVLRDYLAG